MPSNEAEVAPAADASVDIDNRNGTINDAACLERTQVFGVVRSLVEEDIGTALEFAREEGVQVSVVGRRHSMGGQAFFRNALILDMQSYDSMSVDEKAGILRVQSGVP